MDFVRSRALLGLTLLALLMALPACDSISGNDEDDDTPTLDNALVGEWIATAMVFSNDADATESFDMVTHAGAFVAMTFSDDGTVALVEYDPEGESVSDEQGTWVTDGNRLLMDLANVPDTLFYGVDGDIVTVTSPDETWDFDQDGTEEAATLTLTFADAAGNPDPALFGSWTGTAMVFTSVLDPTTSVDVMDVGATFSLTVNNDNTFAVTFGEPGPSGPITETTTGTYVALGGVMWVTDDGSTHTHAMEYTVAGDAATITSYYDEVFDFDEDGQEEPAIMQIDMTK